jgi:hypothetical protein
LKKLLISGLAILLGAGSVPAQATVLVGSVTGGSVLGLGSFTKLDTTNPFTVGQDNFNTNDLYAFDEVQNFVLTDALIANLGLTNIAAGTRVNSHFVFFDPLPNATVQGAITFDTPVLAAITQRSTLIASNYLGATGVSYLDPGSVGLEPGIDFVTLGNPDANTLRINFLTTDSPGDHFRVITLAGPGAVPEPTTWALMLAGVGMIGGVLRRRPRQAARTIAG